MSHKIVQLEKKGQLNRVDNREFQFIEKAMRKVYEEQLRALEESIEASKDQFQRQVDQGTQEFFDSRVKPAVERAVRDVKSGATPFGFKPSDSPFSPERQKLSFAVSGVIEALMPTRKTWPSTKSLCAPAVGTLSERTT